MNTGKDFETRMEEAKQHKTAWAVGQIIGHILSIASSIAFSYVAWNHLARVYGLPTAGWWEVVSVWVILASAGEALRQWGRHAK